MWMPRGKQAKVGTPGDNHKRYLAGSMDWRTGKLSEWASAYLNCEVLMNLNPEENIPTEKKGNRNGPFEDTRVMAKAGLNAALYKNLSLGAGIKWECLEVSW